MTENGLMDGTRTEKLFYNDSHLSKFTAMVLECEPYEKKEGCYAVELDRTAFFPEGGGQYADTGKLKDAKVSDVREKNGRILHITDQPFEVGEIVEDQIYEDAAAHRRAYCFRNRACKIRFQQCRISSWNRRLYDGF